MVVPLILKAICGIPLMYKRFMADDRMTSQTPAKRKIRPPVIEHQARLVTPPTKKARLEIDLLGTPTCQANKISPPTHVARRELDL